MFLKRSIIFICFFLMGCILFWNNKQAEISPTSKENVKTKSMVGHVYKKSIPVDIIPNHSKNSYKHEIQKESIQIDQNEKLKKEFPYMKEQFKPERRVVNHPDYGLIVELHYPKGVVRYELPGAEDTEPTHTFTQNKG